MRPGEGYPARPAEGYAAPGWSPTGASVEEIRRAESALSHAAARRRRAEHDYTAALLEARRCLVSVRRMAELAGESKSAIDRTMQARARSLELPPPVDNSPAARRARGLEPIRPAGQRKRSEAAKRGAATRRRQKAARERWEER